MAKNSKKAVLAFSGGLDTSFCLWWLKKQGYSVMTLTVDTGGFTSSELLRIAAQAKLIGSVRHYSVNGTKELYDKIIVNIIRGNILRGGVYPLCAGPERLIIAQKLADIARKEKVQTVAHGSTGAGNDQVRFDIALKVLAPHLDIIAPVRDLGISREEEIKILKSHKIPVPPVSQAYSVNKGLLGVTVGGKETKSSWESPPDSEYQGIIPIEKTPDNPTNIILSFEKGLPVALDGKKMGGIELLKILSKIGGENGIGKNIHLGNTILGIKGRVAFAAPAITIIIRAHLELEKLVQTKWQLFCKGQMCEVYGNLLHEALYYDPGMRDIEALIVSSQKRVTGRVKVKLFKGNVIITGYESPYSLMNPGVAVYGEENALWTGAEAAGFSKLYGLQSVLAQNAKKLGDNYDNK